MYYVNQKHFQIMNKQIILLDVPLKESVCETCKYFTEQDELFYCKFFEAFLAEETLCIPCDFKECDPKTSDLLRQLI